MLTFPLFLLVWIKDNDDEALCNFAQELSEFTTVLPRDEIEVTAPLLKSLAHVEEVTVRDAVCASSAPLVLGLRLLCEAHQHRQSLHSRQLHFPSHQNDD